MKITSSDSSLLENLHNELRRENIEVGKETQGSSTNITALSIGKTTLESFKDIYSYIKNGYSKKYISIVFNDGIKVKYDNLSEEEFKKKFNEIKNILIENEQPKLESEEEFQKNYNKLINQLEDIDSNQCNLILKTKAKKTEFKVYTNNNESLIFLAGEEKTKMSVSKEKLFNIAFNNAKYRFQSYTSIIIERLLDNSIFDFINNFEKIAFISTGNEDGLKFVKNSQDFIKNTFQNTGWETVDVALKDISHFQLLLEKYQEKNVKEFLFYYIGTSSMVKKEMHLNLTHSIIPIKSLINLCMKFFSISSQHITMILDTPYGENVQNIAWDKDLEILTSSGKYETSSSEEELESSAFSYYFSEALENTKGSITLNDISKYIESKTPIFLSKKMKYKHLVLNSNSRILLNTNITIKSKSEIKPVLGVETIAKKLASIIVNQPDDSGMMVGIFGKWGRGKTYLAELTWKELEGEKPNYKRVVFSAWKYQDSKSSWAYLYENFINEYLFENEELGKIKSYLNKTKKILKLNLEKHTWFPIVSFGLLLGLAIVWSFFIDKIWLVKTLISIFGLLALVKLFFLYLQQKTSARGLYQRYFTRKSYSDNLGFQSEVENELTNLLKTWIPKSNKDEKIVLFVDDIDRCNIEQIIAIIDGLRIILDNPEIHERLIIITAIDEKILKVALKHKYESIEDNQIDNMYREYLEKIFLIGLKLNELNSYEVEDFLNNILPEKQEEKDMDNSYLGDNVVIEHSPFSSGETIKKVFEKDEESSLEIEEAPKIEKSDYEISNKEREYLIEVIKTLKNTTPRKIRIFYYKYLIMKQLFHIRLEEKGLIQNWHDESDEKIIADILVYLANGNEIDEFKNDKDVKVIDELKYVAEMVSVL